MQVKQKGEGAIYWSTKKAYIFFEMYKPLTKGRFLPPFYMSHDITCTNNQRLSTYNFVRMTLLSSCVCCPYEVYW